MSTSSLVPLIVISPFLKLVNLVFNNFLTFCICKRNYARVHAFSKSLVGVPCMNGLPLMLNWNQCLSFIQQGEVNPFLFINCEHKGPLSSRSNLIHVMWFASKDESVGQPLNAKIIQPIIFCFISVHALEVLGKFKVILKWTCAFMKTHLDWYKCATTTCGKLLINWENQKIHMVYRTTNLVKDYDIYTTYFNH